MNEILITCCCCEEVIVSDGKYYCKDCAEYMRITPDEE